MTQLPPSVPQTARPTGPRPRVPRLIVGLATLFLAMLVLSSRLTADPPPPPLPAPVPPAAVGQQLYLVAAVAAPDAPFATQPAVIVHDATTLAERYRIPGGVAAVLSPSGERLFVLDATSLRAVEAASGATIWRTAIDGVAGTPATGQAAMVVTPDGRGLVVLRARLLPTGDYQGSALQWIDATTGALGATYPLPSRDPAQHDLYHTGQLLALPDSAQVLLLTRDGMVRWIDVQADAMYGGTRLSGMLTAGTLAPAAPLLYALTGQGPGIEVTVLNHQTHQVEQTITLSHTEALVATGPPVLVPGTTHLTLLLYEFTSTPGSAIPTVITSQIRVYDTQDWHEVARVMRPVLLPPRTLGASATAIYAIQQAPGPTVDGEGAQLLTLSPGGTLVTDTLRLPHSAAVHHLLVGPLLPTMAVPQTAPGASQPLTNARPLTTTATTTSGALGWVWTPGVPGGADVLAVDGRGQLHLVEPGVVTIARRSQGPPILLAADPTGAMTVVDPATGTRQRLALAPESSPAQAVLSPDGQELAFKSQHDPLLDDANRALRQLVICTIATGVCRSPLATVDALLPVVTSRPTVWAGAELYFVPDRSTVGPKDLWSLNLTTGQHTVYLTATAAVNRTVMQLDPAGRQILYSDQVATVSTTWDGISLMRYDMLTGERQAILDDVQPWEPTLVAPDGQAVASVRNGVAGALELVVVALPEGTSRVRRTLYSPLLVWSRTSTEVLLLAHDPTVQGQGQQALQVWDTVTDTLVQHMEVPVGWSMTTSGTEADLPQVVLTAERITGVARAGQDGLLVTADRRGAAPVLWYRQLPTAAYQLIYVP